ncbi:MAG: hypothetical protein WCL43_07865 [Chlorobium sp.]|jgi:hypothetical protein|nr:MAG: hypothetical protein FDX12_02660 [Chlorobium sp.]
MRILSREVASLSMILTFMLTATQAEAWHDKTHLSIAEAAGFELWYSSAAPDVAKSKSEFRPIEEKNHYFNNNAQKEVDEAMVLEQVDRYNKTDDEEGHLYGAIIGAVRAYKAESATGKYAEYPLVFCAHYVGDLSMPLHNTLYDDFNKKRHTINDGIIEGSVRNNIGFIQRNIIAITIANETDLAREIAKVANTARKLGAKIRKENRNITQDEVYTQVIQSASLFKAILKYVGKKS